MPALKTRTIRALIISDTHSAPLGDAGNPGAAAFRHPLPKVDVLLHCGDLTMIGKLHEYATTIKMLESIDAELKLVIAGNHDITLDEEYYSRAGPGMHRQTYKPDMPMLAREMWREAERTSGIRYLEEGLHRFELKSGAAFSLYASPYQPEFCDWAFPYWRNQDRFNPASLASPDAASIVKNPVPDFPDIDIAVTHGPPLNRLDQTYRGEAVGCPHLSSAIARARPRLHCFGHIHEGRGAERVRWEEGGAGGWKEGTVEEVEGEVDEGEWGCCERVDISKQGRELEVGRETLFVNASIMTVRYKPMSRPWLVEMEVPDASADQEGS